MPGKPINVPMSITTFFTGSMAHGNPEEAFLLYSKGFEHGPPIERDGMGEPWMQDRYKPERHITNPVEQRCGTWLIDAHQTKRMEQNLIKKDINTDSDMKRKWVRELNGTPNYFDEFRKAHPGYKIIGMQGCGNLTMNDWFIGYLRSAFTSNQKKFLHLLKEEFSEREYSCLIKWKSKSPAYTIEDLKFDVHVQRVRFAKNNTDITDQIEFAVFGQKLVENGELVYFGKTATQFADIRHLYRLPNINPDTEFDPNKVTEFKRPRRLFEERRNHDVWFGERQMTRPEYLDLLIHALTEPVLIDRKFDGMGADWDLIEATFPLVGYRKVDDDVAPTARGEWRRYGQRLVQIYFQRNVYAYTMLGLDSKGNLIASAAGGLAGRIGQAIEAMAHNMISAGSRQVLLMDEGNDVFQWVNGAYLVKPRRGRIRAVFVFAKKGGVGKVSKKKKR